MAQVKATDFDSLRKLLKKMGSARETEFVQSLSPEHAELYSKAIIFDWLSVEEHARFLSAAAESLYPDSPRQLEQLGRDLADRTFSGVYRVFLRIPTVVYLIKRAAAVWETYYDTGEATVENIQNGSADLVVSGFPDLPEALRRTTTGHVQVLLEMTGARDVRVEHHDNDPQAWRWVASWT
jgi:hypothetical protein